MRIDWWRFNHNDFNWWQHKCCYAAYVNDPFLVMDNGKIKIVKLIEDNDRYYFVEENGKTFGIQNHPYSHYALVNLPDK